MVSANPSLSNWPQTKIPIYLRAFDVMGYDFHGSWFSDALRELLDITIGLFEVNTIRMTREASYIHHELYCAFGVAPNPCILFTVILGVPVNILDHRAV